MSEESVSPHPSHYRRRSYRQAAGAGDFSFEVRVEESDLWISGLQTEYRSLAYERLLYYRNGLKVFLQRHPEWQDSLAPMAPSAYPLAPPLARRMMAAAEVAGVGPMAAVAGALAEAVGRDLMALASELVVENGGDIFLTGRSQYRLAIFAGTSPLSGSLGIRLSASAPFSCGVCTSSARVGHSLSFGRADALTIVADDTALADAVATAMANRVQKKKDLARVVERALSVKGIRGAVAVLGSELAAGGELELIDISS
ncbi:MAG: UPF0280 family protein [Deltaproteobacteria bacterium]|nr:UPF0280 family protein [Deltaproteobacteria bacterium]